MARLALDQGGQRLARGLLQQRDRDSAADERGGGQRGGTGPAPARAGPVVHGGEDPGDRGVLVGAQRAAPGADGVGPDGGDRRGPADAPLGPPRGRPGYQAADRHPGDRPGDAHQTPEDRGEHGPAGSGGDGGQVRAEGLRLSGVAGHDLPGKVMAAAPVPGKCPNGDRLPGSGGPGLVPRP